MKQGTKPKRQVAPEVRTQNRRLAMLLLGVVTVLVIGAVISVLLKH